MMHNIVLLGAVASLLARGSTAQGGGAPEIPFSLFVFGDSYSASGFNASSPSPSVAQPLGFPPIGPYPDNLLGNPLVANQSTSNGPNWAEYLTASYNNTVTLTYDFAISGASIQDGLPDEVLNLYEPRFSSLYRKSGPAGKTITTPDGTGVSWTSNSSIFATWIGINDINWCSLLFSPTPQVGFEDCLPPRLNQYFTFMDNLYNTGARNFFFVNIPPLNHAPMVTQTNQTIVDDYAKGVKLYNQFLPQWVQNFTDTHKGVRSIVYDAHSLLMDIIDHPNWYGFKNNHCYSCIGCYNVTGCMWSNNYHPVWEVHERLAADMVANLTTIGWPVAQPSDA